MTQNPPDGASAPSTKDDPRLPDSLPQPYSDIALNSIRRDPKRRWSIAQISNRLNPPAEPPATAVAAAATTTAPAAPAVAASAATTAASASAQQPPPAEAKSTSAATETKSRTEAKSPTEPKSATVITPDIAPADAP